MLRMILGRAGTGKTGQILREIRARVEARQGGNILLVPEQYSHEAEREMGRICGDTMSLYAEVLSFSRLAHNVAVELGGSARRYVDAGGRLLQLTLALERLRGVLTVYDGAERSPEQMVQLLDAIAELRRSRTDAETLRALSADTDAMLGAKLRDLALLEEALSAVEEQTAADPDSRLDVLAEQVSRSALLREAHIYIDGFTDFTAQERRVLRELWRIAEVTVLLSCDDLNDGSEVFSLSRRTARLLRDGCREDGVDVQIDIAPSWKKGTALGFLEENLFGWTNEIFDASGCIRLRTAPGLSAECELAAGEILRLVREENCRWRDIAVAVRGYDDYKSVLALTFRRYGIPLYQSERTDIFTRPLPALVSAAYEALADGWSYESMFTYLKTGLTPLSREEVDELENYVLLWSLRGTAWTREAPWRQHPDGFRGEYTPEVNARLDHIDALRRRVAEPLALLQERGRAAATARGQCEALAQFWDDIDLPGRLAGRAELLEQKGEIQSAAEYRQLWELMVSALEQCADVLGDTPMDTENFARLFRRMLSQYDVGTIPVALDRVTAGDFDRMRRRSIRHLLVLGASDDRLPRVSENGGIFTDPERDELRQRSVDLPDSDDILDREFNLIYNVFTLPSETLYVSRSLRTPAGADSRPSFAVDRLRRLFALEECPGSLRLARESALAPAMELACAGDGAARAYFAGDAESREHMERLTSAAAFLRGRLGREGVRALYGDTLWLTASRIDTFASCRFRYFLQYGLKAKPRESAAFEAPELGTFLHAILENVARAAGEQGGFAALSEEEVSRLTDRYVAEYVHSELEDFREKSPRFIYLFRRLTEQVRRIVLDTARELCRSDFRPLDFELNFSQATDMPPIALGSGDDSLVLTGVADRVDGWEHDGKLYLRVVDYKSGKKSFSFTDVWYGMGLQMLLYLFTLEKNGAGRYKKEIVPAGVMYVPARDVLLSSPQKLTEAEIAAEKSKQLRRSGLLLNDEEVLRAMESGEPRYIPVKFNRDGEYTGDALATAEQLSRLSRHVDDILKKMAAELHRGSITADPWYRSESENTCLTCDYYSACHFDEKNDGWRYKTTLRAPAFWARLENPEGGEAPCP